MKLAPAPEQDVSTPLAAARQRIARHPLLAGVASGVLLWTSFPPLEWHAVAWIALAPLFWLVTVREAPLKAYLAAWLGGLTFWLLALEWLNLLDLGGLTAWLVMSLFFSLWWPLFVLVARLAVFRLRIPLMLAAPIVWVALEYGRAHFLSGFPWYYLAHSQFRNLYLIQIADFASSLGISLLIALVNALVVDLATLPLFVRSRARIRLHPRQYVRLCLVTCLIGTTLCYGAIRVSSSQFNDGPRLALLQSNIAQKHKNKADKDAITKELEAITKEFVELIDRALARRQPPDLIVWPETSYPWGWISVEAGIEPAVLESQVRAISPTLTVTKWLTKMESIVADLHEWTDKAKVPMLVGSTYYDHRKNALDRYNSAILFLPNLRVLHVYHKMHLVPFGEYFPLIETFPWLAAITPYGNEKLRSLSFGKKPLALPLGPYRIAVSICFEDTIPHVIRQSFAGLDAADQPDLLINLTNDGWFHGSSELDMHLASAVFRAIENRVPLARAVNTGLSALVDGNGEIRESLAKESKGVLSVTVPLDRRTSYYSRWGDWLGLTCLAISIGLLPLAVLRRSGAPGERSPRGSGAPTGRLHPNK